MRLGQLRLHSQCGAIGARRVFEAPEFVKRKPAITVQLRRRWAGRQCAIKARERVSVPGERTQHRTTIGMQLGRFESSFDGALDVLERFFVTALPMCDDTEEMQCLRTIRLRDQNRSAQPFSLANVTNPERRARTLQQNGQCRICCASSNAQLLRQLKLIEEANDSP